MFYAVHVGLFAVLISMALLSAFTQVQGLEDVVRTGSDGPEIIKDRSRGGVVLGTKGAEQEAKEQLAKSTRHPKVRQDALLLDAQLGDGSNGEPSSWIHSQNSVQTCGVRGMTKNGTVVTRPLRIIMSTTASYVPTLFNWLLYYREVCPDMSSLFFICMDPDSRKMMKKYVKGVKAGLCQLDA